jgi:hypothetical protein
MRAVAWMGESTRAFLFAAFLALAPARLSFCQDTPAAPPKVEVKSEIFSGTVTELAPDSVLVVRKSTGKEPVSRKFLLDAQTRIEGKLRLNARVTVRFETGADEPVHALHIIVR